IAQGNHGDAVVHRANQRAEIATDTIFFTYLGDRLAGDTARTEAVAVGVNQINTLVGAVFAGDVTEVAADAFVVIDAGDAFIVQVQRFPLLQGGHGLADQIHPALETLRVEVI